MKTYWIFKEEPNATINEYRAEKKSDALKLYNIEYKTNFKIKKRNPYSKICIAEKRAYLNYNFRMFSYAE